MKGLVRQINSHLVFPAEQRRLFFRLLWHQLDADVPLARALAAVGGGDLPPPIRKVANTCWERVDGGQTLAAGLDASNSVPTMDIAFVAAAERHNSLQPLLDQMIHKATDDPTLTSVFTSNAYWLFIVSLLLLLLYNGTGIVDAFTAINPAATDLLAARAVNIVHTWGPLTAGGLAILVMLMVWARRNLYGPARRILGGLAREYERRLAIRFCDVAKMLLARGVEHSELLNIAASAMHGGYASTAIDETELRLNQGEDLVYALRGTVLDKTSAAILDQLVPAGDPARYADAFGTVAEILRDIQANFYTIARRAVMMVSISLTAGGLIIVIVGIIETSSLYSTAIF